MWLAGCLLEVKQKSQTVAVIIAVVLLLFYAFIHNISQPVSYLNQAFSVIFNNGLRALSNNKHSKESLLVEKSSVSGTAGAVVVVLLLLLVVVVVVIAVVVAIVAVVAEIATATMC